jgi:predicted Zn-dependent protease
LERTANAEELAGVLAHELQHILKQHVTRSLIEQASMSLIVAAVVGDLSGIASFSVEAAQMLARNRFSRQHESEADEAGLKMLLAARVDPAGMLAFFETLRKAQGNMPRAFAYLSTHPEIDLRIVRLKNLVGEGNSVSKKLLPEVSWDDIKKICPAPAKSAKE